MNGPLKNRMTCSVWKLNLFQWSTRHLDLFVPSRCRKVWVFFSQQVPTWRKDGSNMSKMTRDIGSMSLLVTSWRFDTRMDAPLILG